MYDAVVIGSGFGGLGAALELARRGAKVALCETLKYPGGCASTFSREGFRFEAGATLFSGFAEGQLFARWLKEEQLDVTIDWLDPPVELRTPDWKLPMRRCGVERFAPLKLFADALCQITVQCAADEAEAPFALSSMEYCWRGTAHVRGGIGVLAKALCGAIAKRGGEVLLANKVKGLTRTIDGWRVDTRTGPLETRAVIANVLPGQLAHLAQLEDSALDSAESRVQSGWGAVMRYLVVKPPPDSDPHPHHLQLVGDPARPLVEGNHVFMSISGAHDLGRAPEGLRTITTSTHLALQKLTGPDAGVLLNEIDARLLSTAHRLAPEWTREVRHSMSASPRTFERFTGRANGAVGGVPRRAGMHNYRGLFPLPVRRGLWLVGDSVFPGQSTLATALSGIRVARAVST